MGDRLGIPGAVDFIFSYPESPGVLQSNIFVYHCSIYVSVIQNLKHKMKMTVAVHNSCFSTVRGGGGWGSATSNKHCSHLLCSYRLFSTWCHKNALEKLSSIGGWQNKLFGKSAYLVYGHITLKTPVLVRSPKLSNVEPG